MAPRGRHTAAARVVSLCMCVLMSLQLQPRGVSAQVTSAPTTTRAPSTTPTSAPTESPSTSAPTTTRAPSTTPTSAPTESPSTTPTSAPTESPSTIAPTSPTVSPTTAAPTTHGPTLQEPHLGVEGHGSTGHHWLEHLNNTTLPGLALLGTLHGKWGKYILDPVTGVSAIDAVDLNGKRLTSRTRDHNQVVFPPDWRNYFMIFKGSDEEQNPFVPKYYEMQAANNNNYNLICEKWGFSKDLSGWNIAKLVMRKLPACTGFLWTHFQPVFSMAQHTDPIEDQRNATKHMPTLESILMLSLPIDHYTDEYFSQPMESNIKSRVVLRV